jgi:predicted transport protein
LRALKIWSALNVEQSLVDAANQNEMRDLMAHQGLSRIKMSAEARALFETLRAQILKINDGILELAETNSISYYGHNFFLEVLPRRYRLSLLLPLDFKEVHDPASLAQDATQWKFIVHAKHEGGVFLTVGSDEEIDASIPIVQQARAAV